ncbi:glycosyltransferase family 2 protein [Thiocapsa marina]|uniref:Glycosyl transferase family 2 n=1 Tax=Thiocapsa marina 5811 TaxID=768671 RepID=F9UCG1_9GAMM|nr:glycosyltransferase family 2 protein [Thiocapsa marina]EGV18074.1 glycosyl transferase family 2 [Thiocapsa marina 5811]
MSTDASVPAVSVIVVNYNAGELLSECVGAVLGSDVAVEVVVSDNGSDDRSLERLRGAFGAAPRLRILENRANLGFAAANNRALPLVRADRLLFLNPDCLVGRDTLPRMLAFMDSRPDVGMAGCIVRNPDGSEQVASRRAIPDPWIALKRILRLDRLLPHRGGRRLNLHQEPLPTEPVDVEAISGSFMLVSRRALDAVGPLDEGYFLHCEDLDWFVRFRQAGWTIALVPDVDVIHHKGACSRRNPLLVERHKHRGMERFYRKFQAREYPMLFNGLVIFGIRAHLWGRVLIDSLGRMCTRAGPGKAD